MFIPENISKHSIIFKKKYFVRDEMQKAWGFKRVLIYILMFPLLKLTTDPV